ncbi:AMP-binding protein [Xinfangfangia sp. CPCC 101601]|uniref:AMP-binding protein n=1 Tax=Pseudogemmobacter lacusdianii TaxID=3069608 RepID=A0ABU0W183_9RHOB|nr:AMP-binding protein [Xinfangfangia sp. CPCC 101601]MDQ2067779.1 AMP-binding protein [Xinfangfangia sp. CPCC 101601]
MGAETAFQALCRAAQTATGITFYDRPTEPGVKLSYARLQRKAEQAANLLVSLDLPRQARVALIARNDADFVTLFFAVQAAGCTPCNLAEPHPRKDRMAEVQRLAQYLAAAKADLLIADDDILEMVRGSALVASVQLVASQSLLDETEATAFVPRQHEAADLAVIQFTSGTTSQPKAIALGHSALDHAVRALCTRLQVGPSDCALSWLPLAHDMGFVGMLLCSVYSGIELHLLSPRAFLRAPLDWLDLCARTGASITYVPPFGLELCSRRQQAENRPLPALAKLRVIGVGAEPIKAQVLQEFIARFGLGGREGVIHPSYGMAELGLGVSIGSGIREGICTDNGGGYLDCGAPLPGVDVSIVDPEGQLCAEGQAGRICVSAPSLATGLATFAHPKTAQPLYDTGDIGFLRSQQLFVVGRGDHAAKVNGRMINLDDIDQLLRETTGCTSKDVVSVLEEGPDGRAALVIYLHSTAAAEPEVKGLEAAVFQAFGAPCRIVLTPTSPTRFSASGKVIRKSPDRV